MHQFRSLDHLIKFTGKTFFILLIIYGIFFAFIDIPVARFCNAVFTDSSAWYVANIISMIFKPSHWFALGIIGIIVGAMQTYAHRNHVSHVVLLFSLSVILSYIATAVLKVTLARYRPELLFFQGQYGFHFFSFTDSMNSTPSGHTALAFAGLYALSLATKHLWFKRSCIALACLIAVCRIISLEHYLSDIILGAYIGIMSVYWAAFLLPKLYERFIKRGQYE